MVNWTEFFREGTFEGVVPLYRSVTDGLVAFQSTGFLFPYGLVLEGFLYIILLVLAIPIFSKKLDGTERLLYGISYPIVAFLIYIFPCLFFVKPLYHYSLVQNLTMESVSIGHPDKTENSDSSNSRDPKKQFILRGRNQNFQSLEYTREDISYLSLRISKEENRDLDLSQNPYFASFQRSPDYPLDPIPGLAIVDKNHKRHFLLNWKEPPSHPEEFIKAVESFSQMLGVPLVILDSTIRLNDNGGGKWKIPLVEWEGSRSWGEFFIMLFAMLFAVLALYFLIIYPVLFAFAILPKFFLSVIRRRPFPREGRTLFQEAASTRIFYLGHAVVIAFLIGNYLTTRNDPERELLIEIRDRTVAYRIYHPNKEYSPLRDATGKEFWIGVFFGNPFEIWNRLSYLAEEKDIQGSISIASVTSIRFHTRHSRLDFFRMDSANRREILTPENTIDMRGVDPLTVHRIQMVLDKVIIPE